MELGKLELSFSPLLPSLQVDAIASKANTTCAPYMRSAKKQARRLSNVATDLVRRSSMGTASKAHRK